MTGHLVHVGVPKAGSTSLQAWFEAHPQLAYVPDGLGGFHRTSELVARAAGPVPPPLWHVTSSEALSLPREDGRPPLHGDRAAGPSTAESRERACGMLRSLFGPATILLVTRGFRGSMISGYSQYVKAGGHRTTRELRPDRPVVAEQLDLDALVALYERAFGAGSVIVLPYELLRDDTAAFQAALEARLGLEPGVAPMPRRNPGLSPAGLVWQRRLNVVVRAVARPLPARVGDPLFRRWSRLGTSDRLRPLLSLLERVVPGARDGRVDVAPEVLDGLRGRASSLAGRPFYERYAADYLND